MGRVGSVPIPDASSSKPLHEVRDPIHGFIRFDALERRVIDSLPLQRLKYVRQLGMTYQVYPGAGHARFEHALGVMELAGRAFDSLTAEEKEGFGAGRFREATDPEARDYWRRAVRLAALLHDVGHLPFSHATEGLLPEGCMHEDLTRDVILGSEVAAILAGDEQPVAPADVVKLALSPRCQPETALTPWEAVLNEVVTGDTFGADRMDYLLRDSHHAGVAYGRFDPLRLLASLVVLPRPEATSAAPVSSYGSNRSQTDPSPDRLALGIRQAGLHGAEALLLARYFMFSQVYFHHVRLAYDAHLEDFMRAWLGGGRPGEGRYPTSLAAHLALTDNEVLASLRAAAADPAMPGHEPARRIQERDHFRLACRLPREDFRIEDDSRLDFPARLQAALQARFGPSVVRVECRPPAADSGEVLVLRDDGRVVDGRLESEVLASVPAAWYGCVFAAKEAVPEVAEFVEDMRASTSSESGAGLPVTGNPGQR